MVFHKKYIKETNNVGDTRVRNHFAWLPKTIGEVTVWLETYQTLEFYNVTIYTNATKQYPVYEWVPISNRRIPKIEITINETKK